MRQSATLPRPIFVDLNVLPDELRPRRNPTWYVLGVVAILAASLLLTPLYRLERADRAETARLQAELELINGELARVQIDLGKARELRQRLETTEAAIAALNEERKVVLGDGQALSTNLYVVAVALPPNADLTSVAGSEDQLTLSGRAASPADVLEYSRNLAGSERFSEVRIASLIIADDEEGGSGVTFTIEVTH